MVKVDEEAWETILDWGNWADEADVGKLVDKLKAALPESAPSIPKRRQASSISGV